MVNFDNFDILMENNFQCKEVSATLIHRINYLFYIIIAIIM